MKKICLICEGSYPYITGGVSSWVNQLIRNNPEYQFKIIGLIPSEEFADIKYDIPSNVVEIKKVLLNNFSKPKPLDSSRFKFNSELNEMIKMFFNFENLSSTGVMDFINYFSQYNPEEQQEISLSFNFWNAITEHYNEQGYEKGLNEYYWIYKNLFLNIISLGNIEFPEADIYHSVSTGYAGIILSIAKYRGIAKTLITEHGIYFREREEDILSSEWISDDFKPEWINFFNSMCRAAYQYSDKVISLFDYNAKYALEHGLNEEKLLIIPNGIDLEDYLKVVREKKEKFSIGSVLRVVPIKDVKMMIKAFKIVASRLEDVHLYLIGPTTEDEDYFKECEELVEDLELQDVVTFTGKANVKEYYKFLDLFLLSSISEGQPLSILEALACGIPCVSTNVGNCREILSEKDLGECGLVVPSTSYTKLAEAIITLYNDRGRLEEMGKNGIEIVKKYYSKESFEKNYKKVYLDLIEGE